MNTLFSRSRRGAGRTARHVNSLPALLAALLVAVMGACSKSNEEDALNLLSTVPADAEMVAVANLNTLVSQTGGSVKDGKVTDADRLLSLIGAELTGKNAEVARWLVSPESGIDCTTAVIFTCQSRLYLSALIADETALRAGIDKFMPGEWATSDKVSHKGNLAILGERVWVLPSDDPTPVSTFANLSEVESFRSNSYAPTLAKSPDAMAFWGSIDRLMRSSGMSFSDKTMMKMAMGMAFGSPSCIAGEADLTADGVSASLRVLDADGKPAKCELAVSRIDTKLVASLGGNANTVLAMAVSPRLVQQAMQLASSTGGKMPQAYSQAIECLDGTIAYATDLSPKERGVARNAATGAVQTNGKNNAPLLQALESLVGKVQIDGNTFRFADSGYGNGIAPLADVASAFEGAWIGVATTYTLADGKGKGLLYATLSPKGESLQLNLKYKLK